MSRSSASTFNSQSTPEILDFRFWIFDWFQNPKSKIKNGGRLFWSARGQSTTEYALLVGLLLVGALVGIRTYVTRGLQARYRSAVDGATTAIHAPTQYEPYYSSSTSVERTSGHTLLSYNAGKTTYSTQDTQAVVESGSSKSESDLSADDDWK